MKTFVQAKPYIFIYDGYVEDMIHWIFEQQKSDGYFVEPGKVIDKLPKVQGTVVTTTVFITKTCLYNLDPFKPHFYIVKLGFTGVYIIFLISAQKHRLWVLVRTASSRRF